jgi:tetratricopeptide (TPR) repeat protein
MLASRGEYGRSFVYHRAAAECRPDAKYLYHSGSAALAAGRTDDAAWYLDKAVSLEPCDPQAWRKRGDMQLHGLVRPEEALRSYIRAIHLAPDDLDSYQSAGRCVLNGDGPAAAIARLRKALPPGLDSLRAESGVALALPGEGCFEEAVPIMLDVLRRSPDDRSHLNQTLMRALADVYTGLRDWRSAQHWYERAIAAGNDPAARTAYVLYWSRLGDFERARRFYRSDIEGEESIHGWRPAARLWQGQNIPGKILRLVAGDIYYGDALHYARFAHFVKEAGARVILESPRRIRSLLRTIDGVDTVVAPRDPVPPLDYESLAFWMFYALRIPVDRMIGRCPYLQAPAELRGAWRQRIKAISGINVGIAWSGSQYRIRDRFGRRSMRLEDLRPLALVPGITIYSLQCGAGRTELLESNPAFPAVDLAPDFPNTAAAIEALDLVITIDTSIAHLAGALGKRTFLMLPYDACFRWMVDRDDTPWYPATRLFRQTKPGDWSGVVASVVNALNPRAPRR